ncbi:MAG: hypothetical protein P1V97_16575, partial [Planctomycetota bacterium]|nr:hypothetical protein [Planctomycetota bacterium]
MLERSDLWNSGSYGDVLVHGLVNFDPKPGNLILERTGPFIPPITHPLGTLLVNNEAKKKMERCSLFSELNFEQVIIKKMVELHWEDWSLELLDVPIYPAENEPVNYIWKNNHNLHLASKTAPIWKA